MLEIFRRLSQNPIFKILLAILIFSFIYLGVNEFITGASREYVAVVGGDNYIYTDQFLEEKQKQIKKLRQAYPQLTDQELKYLNINKNIVNNLILKKLLELESKSLGILISDEVVINQIKSDNYFKNKEGNFDPQLFKNILAYNQISQKEFVTQLKNEIAANIITQTFSSSINVPNMLAEMVYRYNAQQRSATIITANYSKTYNPTKEEIENYYNEHISQFSTMEKRDVEFIFIQPTHVKSRVVITEEEIAQELANIAQNDHSKAERENIRQQLKFQKINQKLNEIIQDIDDEVASGDSLSAIAKKHQIGYGKIDRYEQNDNRTPKFKDFDKHVRALESSQPSELLNIDDNKPGYYVININKIYPKKPLGITAEINTKINRILTKNFRNKENQKLIVDAAHKLEKGDKISSLSEVRIDHHTFSRPTSSEGENSIPFNIITELFNLNRVDQKTEIFPTNNNSYAFLVLDKIINIDKKANKEELASLKKVLDSSFSSLQQQEFIQSLQAKYPVTIRTNLLDNL